MSVKSVKLEVSNQNQRMSILAPSVQFTSVIQSCPTLWDCSTPDLPVYQQLLETTQTHVHWVSDDILPSHPPLFPSSPTFNLSQHQCLFQWVSSLHQVAKALEFQLQYQSFHQKVPFVYLVSEERNKSCAEMVKELYHPIMWFSIQLLDCKHDVILS